MYNVQCAFCILLIDVATWCWLSVSRSWGHRNWWGSCRKLFSCYRYYCCCCYCCFLALLFFLVIVVVVVVISMKPVAGGSVGWGRVGKTITEPPIEISAQALMTVTMMLLSLCLI